MDEHDDDSHLGNDCESGHPLMSRADGVVDNVALQRPKPGAVMMATGIGIFLSAADYTIIIASYGRIGNDLDALGETGWVALAYYLALSTVQPLCGRFSARYGARTCLLAAYAAFGLGSFLCGCAASIWQLAAARLCQGAGGAGMTTLVTLLMSDLVRLEDRGLWQGVLNLIFAAGAGLGGPLGGFFADSAWGWRGSFFVQVPLSVLAFWRVWVVLRGLEGPRRAEAREADQPASPPPLDLAGAATLVAALVALLVGLDRGTAVGWSSAASVVSIAAFFPLAYLFFRVEQRAAAPFVPPAWVARRSRLPVYGASLFAFGANVGHAYTLALFYQVARAATPLHASVLLLPGTAAEVTGTLVAGLLLKKAAPLYPLIVAGYGMVAAGNVALALGAAAGAEGRLGVLILGNTVACLGNGFGIVGTLVNLVASAPTSQEQAVAVSSCYLFRVLGSITAVSLSTALVQRHLAAILSASFPDDVGHLVEQIRHSLDFLDSLDPAMAATLRAAYGRALGLGLWLPAVYGVCAFVSSVFLRTERRS